MGGAKAHCNHQAWHAMATEAKVRCPNYEFYFSAGPQWAPTSLDVTMEVAIPKWSRHFWPPAMCNGSLPLDKAHMRWPQVLRSEVPTASSTLALSHNGHQHL